MKPLEVRYIFKRTLFESEEERIVDLITVSKEEHYEKELTIEILASSLKETSIFKANRKLLKELNHSPEFKQYISEEYALDLCKRIQANQELEL
ncbi:hypothetical protein G3A_01900 [Bacillus sp. 17376]|uniref:Uncharacterized protein n=1 Tax=Mesobacillus boroniphilus JCM 21738 TaxID=1294265 RepID=W4RVH3_9BACI|nr:hypothetical protein [Mesobacillus boroniphilus]ESU34280.1 hypothetical protein G3A_01900 [Bacillus sp. 17376]GAE48301.1 hypothetical protein JCM21738_5408 [Mesobacillus boroniphilus JCM 21738]